MSDVTSVGAATSPLPWTTGAGGAAAGFSVAAAAPATSAATASGAASAFQDLSASLQAFLIQQQAQPASGNTSQAAKTVPGNLDSSGRAAPALHHHRHHHHHAEAAASGPSTASSATDPAAAGTTAQPSGTSLGAALAADLRQALATVTGAG
jgi:hypothetical protein